MRLPRLLGSGLAGWVSPIFCPAVFEFSIEGLAALGSGRRRGVATSHGGPSGRDGVLLATRELRKEALLGSWGLDASLYEHFSFFFFFSFLVLF